MEELEKKKDRKKFLTFSIGSEFYGTSIEQVMEIIRFDQLTTVHDTQEYIKGVINLRGKIIPVMDLRLKLGLSFMEYNDKTVLIILDVSGEKGNFLMALAVDAVHEVITPSEESFEKTPSLGLKMKRDYLKGIIKSMDRMVMILDINRIITADEIINLKESTEV